MAPLPTSLRSSWSAALATLRTCGPSSGELVSAARRWAPRGGYGLRPGRGAGSARDAHSKHPVSARLTPAGQGCGPRTPRAIPRAPGGSCGRRPEPAAGRGAAPPSWAVGCAQADPPCPAAALGSARRAPRRDRHLPAAAGAPVGWVALGLAGSFCSAWGFRSWSLGLKCQQVADDTSFSCLRNSRGGWGLRMSVADREQQPLLLARWDGRVNAS